MKPSLRVGTILAALCVYSAAESASEITGITLSPSSSVIQGTNVKVTVKGTGVCTVFVETNGASDVEGGFGDYQIGPGTLPLSVSFKANTIGSFQIAALGVDANQKNCVHGSAFAVNTILKVRHPADPARFKKKRYRQPKIIPKIPDPGPLRAPIVMPSVK